MSDARRVFTAGMRILFQGDSITDGNRGRDADPNHILGHGYQFIIACKYGAELAERGLVFVNRGVSGNKVSDLAKRWQAEAIELRPDLLSILVGVNDLNGGVSAEEYEGQYDQLLADTVKALPGVKLVLGEPFGLPVGWRKEGWERYGEGLKACQAIVGRLAGKYHGVLVPYQRAFEEAARRAPADYWIWDGVHPTYPGHQVMAEAWVQALMGGEDTRGGGEKRGGEQEPATKHRTSAE